VTVFPQEGGGPKKQGGGCEGLQSSCGNRVLEGVSQQERQTVGIVSGENSV